MRACTWIRWIEVAAAKSLVLQYLKPEKSYSDNSEYLIVIVNSMQQKLNMTKVSWFMVLKILNWVSTCVPAWLLVCVCVLATSLMLADNQSNLYHHRHKQQLWQEQDKQTEWIVEPAIPSVCLPGSCHNCCLWWWWLCFVGVFSNLFMVCPNLPSLCFTSLRLCKTIYAFVWQALCFCLV